MKNIFKIFLPLLFLLVLIRPASASGEKTMYFFYGDGCPHCAKEEKFLDSTISKKYPQLKIERFEVWNNRDNANILSEVAKKLSISASGVPVTVIGDKNFVGYQSDSATGVLIEKAILDYLADDNCQDYVAPILNNTQSSEPACQASTTAPTKLLEKIKIPFLGEVDAKTMSLPILTVVIGAIDGFNPCAMWVLIFLISLLLGMKDRKKMWILGLAFIVSSGAVYFLFLSAWLNLFLFIGFIFWVRIAIALVALGSGGYHLWEYWKNRAGNCNVVDTGNKKKIIERLKKVVSAQNFFIALGGIIILAAAINLVELVCSAGLPAIYTQVLALSSLPWWQYYGYLLLYIFVFMFDDVLIFVIAMTTLKLKGVTSKYTRYSNVIGGVIMILVGILLIFKPGWLMFG